MSLTGKVAVVTGGSRGIGLAIASAFAAEGIKVVMTGRTAQTLASAKAHLAAAGADVETCHADVRLADDMVRVMATTVQQFGGLDILVNNAGVGYFVEVVDMPAEQWAEIIDTNLTGVFNACQAAIPYLRQRGGGYIFNISSLAGKNSFAGAAAYCASKAGLNAFSEALMQEVRHDNIRVSYVMPGSVATGFSGRGEHGKADWKIQPEDVGQVVLDLLAMPPRSLPSRVELRPSKPQKS